MNSIKLNATQDIELVRTTLRPEANRESDGHASAHPEATAAPLSQDGIKDVIKVSDQATTIRSLVEQASQLPEVRSEQVERLRALVQSGVYRPDAADIADALLKSEG